MGNIHNQRCMNFPERSAVAGAIPVQGLQFVKNKYSKSGPLIDKKQKNS